MEKIKLSPREFTLVAKGIATKFLFAGDPHPSYIVKKMEVICRFSPMWALSLLDEINMKLLKDYFEKREIDFEASFSELKKDHNDMPMKEYAEKWGF